MLLFLSMSKNSIIYRKALKSDISALTELIQLSARGLSHQDYTPAQIEAALGTVWGVDEELIDDQSYFIAESNSGVLAGCGGWSKRAKLFGASDDDSKSPLLDPKIDAARIRAFFVHPDFIRLGIGREIIRLCENEAMNIGFNKMELMATLPGHRLYKSCGYLGEQIIDCGTTPENTLKCVPMNKTLR